MNTIAIDTTTAPSSIESCESVSRRAFMMQLTAVTAAGTLGLHFPVPADANGAHAPTGARVVGIHMDLPFLDDTGRCLPYRPPAGARCGAPLAQLSEAQLRAHHCYL